MSMAPTTVNTAIGPQRLRRLRPEAAGEAETC